MLYFLLKMQIDYLIFRLITLTYNLYSKDRNYLEKFKIIILQINIQSNL